MYLMDLIIKVLRVKSKELTMFAINTLVIVVFYYLLFENSEIIYPVMLSIFLIVIYFISEIIRYKSFQEKLNDSKRSPNYSGSDVSSNEDEILSIISDIHKDYLNKIHTLNQEKAEGEALFSQWIHNMKTSITVIDLACEKSLSDIEKESCIEDIKEENNTLKKNLEECLNVLRLDDFSRDYITEHCKLRDLINNIVNLNKRDFIYKGVFPKVNVGEDIYVYTDRKWCEYMINQIISNSIKYSESKSGKVIEISAIIKDDIIELVVKDDGIGITKEDLPRIFEPFFTGSNGRKERSATGIGLYMVNSISRKLGHSIEIESELNIGTLVKVKFKEL